MRDKCQGHRLVVSQSQSPSPQSRVLSRIRRLGDRSAVSRQRILELVISVQSRNLFNQINFAFHVEPPTRDVHGKLFPLLSCWNQGETKPLQDAENLTRTHVSPQDPTHFGDVQRYRGL